VIGQQLSHYEIVSRLGEGQMGAIYKARDTEAGRMVAINMLAGDRFAHLSPKR
jgi:eukaryotic-like serine/threonine-protein kinase